MLTLEDKKAKVKTLSIGTLKMASSLWRAAWQYLSKSTGGYILTP